MNDEDLINLNLDFNTASTRVSFIPKKVKKLETAKKEDDKVVENERKCILDSVISGLLKGEGLLNIRN